MSTVTEESFKINLTILKCVRLYEFTNYKTIHKTQAWLCYSVCVVALTFLTVLNLLVQEKVDVVQFNHAAMFIAESLCWTFKLIPFLTKSKQIKLCINYFNHPMFAKMINTFEQKTILDNCIKTCKRNSLLFLVIVVSGTINFNTKPLFWKGRKFPVSLLLPFDVTTNFGIYTVWYIFIAAAVTFCGLTGTTVDPLIGGLAYHATSQVSILKENLLNLHGDFNAGQIDNKLIAKKIIKCVTHHRAILKFIELYEECFSLAIFSQFAGSVVGICFCCLQLSMIDFMSFEAIAALIYIFIILGQIYFYCYFGSLLLEENWNLFYGVYLSQWYNFSESNKKSLMIIMERSKRPLTITVAKLLPLKLETFMTMLKRTYSLLAVLKNYQ